MRLRAIETDQTEREKTPPEKELEEVGASDDALSETIREKTVKNEIIAIIIAYRLIFAQYFGQSKLHLEKFTRRRAKTKS